MTRQNITKDLSNLKFSWVPKSLPSRFDSICLHPLQTKILFIKNLFALIILFFQSGEISDFRSIEALTELRGPRVRCRNNYFISLENFIALKIIITFFILHSLSCHR